MFTYSNIYYMRYTCVTSPHVFDQLPLIIPLEIRGPHMIAINLHWIPGALRSRFVQLIVEMQRKSINQNMFRLWYRMIKYQPQLSFTLSAIRKYYISHCTNVRMIPQDQWDTLTMVSQSLYRARFMQRSGYNPQQHIQQRGQRIYPNNFRPQIQQQQQQVQAQPQVQQQQVQQQNPNPNLQTG